MGIDLTNAALISLAALAVVAAFIVRRGRDRLHDIRGPDAKSFWLGNFEDIRYQDQVGDCEFPWMREYGGVWKIHGIMGSENLVLADPKALQYVLQTSGYRFPKRRDILASVRMILGEGIVYVHGEQHNRHRKIMNPAFSAPQLKSFLSLFQNHGGRLVQKWKDEVVSADPSADPVFNVHRWLSRTTLDVIGETGFNFDFGALNNHDNPLSKVYENLFIDSMLYPHRLDLVFRHLWRQLPAWLLWYLRYIPSREYTRFRQYQNFMRKFARELLFKSEAVSGSKDVMSILIRANGSESDVSKLREIEVLDQISTLVLAGHDTTASSLTWWLWELAKNSDWQTRVRDELKQARAKVEERGDDDFSIQDLDGMSLMHATLKGTMRLHPIVWTLGREAGQDDVIPLAFPIISKSGKQLSAIPVKKGQMIDIAIAPYNRNPEVWGEDADMWRPERFLEIDKSRQTSVGVYANLCVRSSYRIAAGLRGCIGWRFAIIEMQAIAAKLVENFEFALPPQTEKTKIKRKPAGLMAPMADGYRGIWMGLRVKALA
ncbi:cytochrome P450 [Vararia minispora EC-137]|uniref:Cytochrome P450 n=1 Tax=Vararia minispora EC-137 TaxID=1314806 RepID=A0ACB8QFL1_9AGAM|nr:cytochrome P450 [Vararia minispora EC-137]